MPITSTQVDMLLAYGSSILTSILVGVLAVLSSKHLWDFLKHVVNVIDDRTLAKDPERARRVAELRRARHGNE
ncbi:hypothetical protein [Curtobacterium flaccumfaciens]|uniref:hypothetical protein n=1 Tax=Curtobacterium flaccumfaciens TaxID=2035 RepID=UPI001BDDE434|nr:hypothetical protein [Curtobacterium flaccumfaciens]MBT1633110.1 hypothetical protein [Curtobacterium flaccumfaciens pv. oortii]MCX2843545.1 hypothetical protein [Curtobacterium flaccumfaciens pv. oortii]